MKGAVLRMTLQDSDGFLLRSIKITLRDEPINNTSKDNRRDHYYFCFLNASLAEARFSAMILVVG